MMDSMIRLPYPDDADLTIDVKIKDLSNSIEVFTNGGEVKKTGRRTYAFNDTKGNPVTLSYSGKFFRKSFNINGVTV